MGLRITTTRQPYGSAAIHAKEARAKFNPAALKVKLTGPARESVAPPAAKTESELAVAAQNRGVAGNFKNTTGDILAAIRRAR
jgi:hypothetical protein